MDLRFAGTERNAIAAMCDTASKLLRWRQQGRLSLVGCISLHNLVFRHDCTVIIAPAKDIFHLASTKL